MANALASLVFAVLAVLGLIHAAVAGPFEFALALMATVGIVALGLRVSRVEKRERRKAEMAASISTVWLNDVFEEKTFSPRRELLEVLTADEAWALARLHDAGVPADYVAARWDDNAPLDARALTASYRAGGAS
jgi:hypothetical protein